YENGPKKKHSPQIGSRLHLQALEFNFGGTSKNFLVDLLDRSRLDQAQKLSAPPHGGEFFCRYPKVNPASLIEEFDVFDVCSWNLSLAHGQYEILKRNQVGVFNLALSFLEPHSGFAPF